MLSCPHCGAANPGYRETRNTTVNNTTHITNNNVTINNYYGSPRTRQAPRNNYVQEQTPPPLTPEQEETRENWYFSLACSAFTAFFTLLANCDGFSLFGYIRYYIGDLIGNFILFKILSSFKANIAVKLAFCLGFMILGCIYIYNTR